MWGGCVCVSPQMQRLDAEHKNFTLRVVAVCVSSSASFFILFYFFFNFMVFSIINRRSCFDIKLVTSLEQAHVEQTRRVAVGCFPEENFCLQRWLGLLAVRWEVAQESGQLLCACWASFRGLNGSHQSGFLLAQWLKQAGSLHPGGLIEDQFSL